MQGKIKGFKKYLRKLYEIWQYLGLSVSINIDMVWF